MFGFGKKKKRKDFITILSDLANISKNHAEEFFENNSGLIWHSYSRGLDPLACVIYVAEKNMEKIYSAHALNDMGDSKYLLEIKDIPHFLLLVCLRAAKSMEGMISSQELNLNFKYWNSVLKLPININNPSFTYGDKLQELVDDIKK